MLEVCILTTADHQLIIVMSGALSNKQVSRLLSPSGVQLCAGAAGDTAGPVLQPVAAVQRLQQPQVSQPSPSWPGDERVLFTVLGLPNDIFLPRRDVNEAILDAAVMLEAPRASLNILCASRSAATPLQGCDDECVHPLPCPDAT